MGGCLSKCLNRRESEEAEAAFTEPEEFQLLPGEAPVGLVEEPRGKAPVAHMEQLDQTLEVYQRGVSERDSALQQLAAAVQQRETELNQLKSDNAAKDEQIQTLALKLSKKSEEISTLQEDLELSAARHDEDKTLIQVLKSETRSINDDTDSLASGQGSVSEEEMELRLSEKDEQHGQTMMLIKESMSQQLHENQSELEKLRTELAQWQAFGQSYQNQMQAQIAEVHKTLTEQYEKQVNDLKQSADLPTSNNTTAPAAVSDEEINRIKQEHEDEMKVLVETAEEEAQTLRTRITELEQSSNTLQDNTNPNKISPQEQTTPNTTALQETITPDGQYDQLEEQLQLARDELTLRDSELTALKAELSKVQTELQESNEVTDKSELQTENQTLSEQVKDLTSQVDVLFQELNQSQNASAALSDELLTLREELSNFRQTNELLLSEKHDIENNLQTLHNTIQSLQTDLDNAKTTNEKLNAENAVLTNENQTLHSSIDRHSDLTHLQTQYEELRAELDNKTIQLEQSASQLQLSSQALKENTGQRAVYIY